MMRMTLTIPIFKLSSSSKMSDEEKITCAICNAKVKPSSMERHIITAKHKKYVETPLAPKPFKDAPPVKQIIHQKGIIIRFD